MKFRAGTSEFASFAGNTTATPVTLGFRDDLFRGDWALLRLNNCIGKRPEIGWLETSNMRLPDSNSDRAVAKAVALGYAAYKDRGVLDGGRGELTSIDPRNGLRA